MIGMENPLAPPNQEAQLLREYLAQNDCACPGCGYNLRMLESNRCPECAMEVQLGVQLVEARLGALIVGVVAMAAGAGFGALIFIIGLIETWGRSWGSNDTQMFAIFGGVAVVHGLGLWVWLRCWKRVRKWPARMWVALACWLLPLLMIMVMVNYVR